MSGISGGSFFTSTASIAFSDVIKGVGLFVGGPFGTPSTEAGSTAMTAEEKAAMSYAKAIEYQEAGYVDPLSNLKDEPVFIYSGAEDTTAQPLNQVA